jgi:hypothetical protein
LRLGGHDMTAIIMPTMQAHMVGSAKIVTVVAQCHIVNMHMFARAAHTLSRGARFLFWDGHGWNPIK